MSREMNLTDRWVGNYFLHGRPWPVAADLVQAGERLTGSMRDGVTDREYSVTEVALEAGLSPGVDEQIVDRLRRMFPDAPATPIRYVTHLPPDSALEGWVKDLEVYFLKAYEGTHYGGYQIGDKLVGFQKAAHVVHYGGRVSSDGEEIEGKWWIEDTPGHGPRRAEGAFTLRRQEGAELS
ncbi:MAG: hypothetical protein ACHRXM_15110 [Isosphaerales bacterium]